MIPKAMNIVNWVRSIHHLLLLNISMNGLHSGFISHGRLMSVVRGPRVPLSTPISLKTAKATVLTMAYGSPSIR